MRLLSYIITLFITLPLTLFSLSFALSNPLPVGINLWPFTFAATPAWSLGIVGVVLLGSGFFMGALFVGLNTQQWRWRAWQQQRRAERAERDLAAHELKQQNAPVASDTAVLADQRTGMRKTGVMTTDTQSALRDTESSPFRFF